MSLFLTVISCAHLQCFSTLMFLKRYIYTENILYEKRVHVTHT